MDLWMLIPAAAGSCGGLAGFVMSLKQGRVRDRWVRKIMIEIVGAGVVAFFVTLPFRSVEPTSFGVLCPAFLLGLGWDSVIKHARGRVSAIVEAAITGSLKREGEA